MKHKSIPKIIVMRFFGFLFFLFFLYVANLLRPLISWPAYSYIVLLVNTNIGLIIAWSILLLVGEVFLALKFPLSLPGPIFYAFGVMLVMEFVFKLLEILDKLLNTKVLSVIAAFDFILLPLIFIGVLIGGYVEVFGGKKMVKKSKAPDWEDIGDEFRQLIYDMLSNIRKVFKPKKR